MDALLAADRAGDPLTTKAPRPSRWTKASTASVGAVVDPLRSGTVHGDNRVRVWDAGQIPSAGFSMPTSRSPRAASLLNGGDRAGPRTGQRRCHALSAMTRAAALTVGRLPA